LGPYISRGFVSTKQIFRHIQSLNLPENKTEKLIQELAWRDYWQQVWIEKGDEIKSDLKNTQTPLSNREMPLAILEGTTGIDEVDQAIDELKSSGYMHNHMRMYVASICCNLAQSHWLNPAKWMYSELLDGDLASNFLSWQWVAGSFSNKKYYANQENINRFFFSEQQKTFLDVDYADFENNFIPTELQKTAPFQLETLLPNNENPGLDKDRTTLIYNYYNIDPHWHEGEQFQRVFLLEPSFFKEYPVSQKCIDFAIKLTENIAGMKIYVGEYNQLREELSEEHLVYKEHPTNKHYRGKEEPRDWMFEVKGYFPSFFAFWKQCKKEIWQ